jgi:gamma-glutamyltranspeptidase/glutathione hydrolase
MSTTPMSQYGPRPTHRPPILARHMAVASGHYLATDAGMRILRRGGNAIDAGVAAGICIDVLMPDQCSFGGVAPIIVYHRQTGDLVSISGLGPWGRSATIEHFLEHEGGQIPFGVKRCVVPGAPDAWLTALARYGTMTFAEVVQPAIELCEAGHVVYDVHAAGIRAALERIRAWPSSAAIFLRDGEPYAPGEVLYQHDLTNTFRRMAAAEGRAGGGRVAGIEAARDEFYTGEISKQIAAFIQSEGGFITEQDLADFHSAIETPVGTTYRGVDVFSCGPWSQGPVLPQALNILEGFPLRELGHNSADYLHVCAEAINLAMADRERYYGDPHFVEVPLDVLLSKGYGGERRAEIDPTRAFGRMAPHGEIAGFEPYDLPLEMVTSGGGREPDTSYVCVVDEAGNAFSATPSDGAGNTPIVPGLGLICSSRGSQSWLIPRHASALAGGKRPRLTPNPAIAFKDGKLFMPFGTPMSDMQPQAMLQTFLNVVDFGMNVQLAIEQPRFKSANFPETFWPHTYQPGRLYLEGRIPRDVGDELAARGHDVQWWADYTDMAGKMCAIEVDHERGTLSAGADVRCEAYAAGW